MNSFNSHRIGYLLSLLAAGCVSAPGARSSSSTAPLVTSNAPATASTRGPRRLPAEVVPERYEISLAPDLHAGTFSGRETIFVRLAKSTDTIILHAADLHLIAAEAQFDESSTKDSRSYQIGAQPTFDGGTETVTLHFKMALPAGRVELKVRWSGSMSTKLVGMYRVEQEGQTYAFTQFEPTDARRLFPCFDEPAMKARFQLDTEVDAGNLAVSNMPIAAETTLPNGRHLVRFAETPPLSTYLVTLAIGPFVALEDHSLRTPIRVITTQKSAGLGQYALTVARDVLPHLEAYFGESYPYPKLDLIAVPDFVAGAMENAGAITFKDDAVLVDLATASPWQKRETMRTVAHEMSHQWFGDLVTMKWWDDLWLNESFAAWFEFKMQDLLHPEWETWSDFEGNREWAMGIDGRAATHPIQQQIETAADARNAFDGITYQKGAAVLRMLEQYVGQEQFRRGVVAYIRAHREGNTTANDLWHALDAASGKPVSAIASAWIQKVGSPEVDVSTSCTSGRTRVHVEQRRFFYAPPKDGGGSDDVRPIPICMRTVNGTQCELLTTPQATFTLNQDRCVSWLDANAHAAGLYTVKYDDALLDALSRAAPTQLDAPERMALLSDTWGFVYRGDLSLSGYLGVADHLRNEKSRPVFDLLTGPFFTMNTYLLDAADKPLFARLVERTYGSRFQQLGWNAAKDESDETKLIRSSLVELLGYVARSPSIVDEANRLRERYLKDPSSVDGALVYAIVGISAQQGDASLWSAFLQGMRDAKTPEQKNIFLSGLCHFRDPALIRRTVDLLLTDAVARGDLIGVIGGLLSRSYTRPAAWSFVKEHYAEIVKKVPAQSLPDLISYAGTFCDADAAREVEAFFAAPAHHIEAADLKLRAAIEDIGLCSAFRARQRPPFAEWLHVYSTAQQSANAHRETR